MRTRAEARSDQEQAGKISESKIVLDRKTFFVRQWRTIFVCDRWTPVRKRHTPKFFRGVPRPPVIMPRKQTDRASSYFASESIESTFSVLRVEFVVRYVKNQSEGKFEGNMSVVYDLWLFSFWESRLNRYTFTEFLYARVYTRRTLCGCDVSFRIHCVRRTSTPDGKV